MTCGYLSTSIPNTFYYAAKLGATIEDVDLCFEDFVARVNDTELDRGALSSNGSLTGSRYGEPCQVCSVCLRGF